jgi:hypothetical protein
MALIELVMKFEVVVPPMLFQPTLKADYSLGIDKMVWKT